jgi:DNA-binding transcriptional MerR regulator
LVPLAHDPDYGEHDIRHVCKLTLARDAGVSLQTIRAILHHHNTVTAAQEVMP